MGTEEKGRSCRMVLDGAEMDGGDRRGKGRGMMGIEQGIHW